MVYLFRIIEKEIKNMELKDFLFELEKDVSEIKTTVEHRQQKKLDKLRLKIIREIREIGGDY